MDDPKFLRKHIKTGGIDAHPYEKALVVSYELEATILGEGGDPMIGDKKECQKLIRLKDLSPSTDISALAREIVQKCKLIPPAKLPEVEQLLYYLQNRKNDSAVVKKLQQHNQIDNHLRTNTNETSLVKETKGESADIDALDDYIELLYEEIADKIRGTGLVLQLAKQPENLEEMMRNETLLGALARVLREDWKKSLELASNICYIFFCFSTFTQFHSMISHFKVGALCMQIVEFEVKRCEVWKEDLKAKKSADKRDKETEKSFIKLQILMRKQEQLMRVSIYLLLNLAEDVKTEVKMVNRGIVDLLCQVMEVTENQELLMLTATFLHKLSLFVENKCRIKQTNIIPKLVRCLMLRNSDLISIVLRLLFNLSFDSMLRSKMTASGAVTPVSNFITDESHRSIAYSLLYHLSMDEDAKAMLTYTDTIGVAVRTLGEADSSTTIQPELIALLINLALNERNAQLLCGEDGSGLKLFISRGFQHKDPLLMKIVRNISQHSGPTKIFFVEFVADLANVVQKLGSSHEEFVLECLGTLSNLTIPDLDFTRLLDEYNLLPWLKAKLELPSVADDLVLEVVILLGTVASDSSGAEWVYGQLLSPLINLLSAKQEDDETVLQIVFVLYKLLCQDPVRQLIVTETQVPAYLVDLMHDKNPEIRHLCDISLEVLAESGADWGQKILEEKFRWHNAQWLEMVGATPEANTNGLNDSDPLSPDDSESDELFNNLYGLRAEEILENYEAERPISRMGRHPDDSG